MKKSKPPTPSKNVVYTFIAIFFGAMFTCALKTTTAQEADAKPIIATLIAGLKNRENSLSSARGYAVKEYWPNPDVAVQKQLPDVIASALAQGPSLSHIYFVLNGPKIRQDEKITRLEKDGHISILSYVLESRNEQRVQRWQLGAEVATELSDLQLNSESQNALQFPKIELDKRLSIQLSSPSTRFVGREKVGDVETYVVERPSDSKKWIDKWWIAPQLSSLIMKHERRAAEIMPEEPEIFWRSVTIVDGVLKVGENLWVPEVIRSVGYTTFKGETKESWKALFRWRVLSVKVGERTSDQDFELPLPLGTRVGGEGRETYIVGGDTSRFEAQMQNGKPGEKALSDQPVAPSEGEAKP